MRRLTLLLALALGLCGFLASSASAAFNLEGLDVTFAEEDGTPTLLAGSHPFQMATNLGVSTVDTPEGKVPEGELRNLTISQIEGFVGSQTAVPTCSQVEFNDRFEGRPACKDETAVGYGAMAVEFEVIPPAEEGKFFHVPVYNLDPPPGVAAQLGFIVLNVPVTIDVKVSPEPPYNLVAELRDVPQAILLYSSEVVLWGNPLNEAHDELRGNCLGEIANTTTEPVSEGTCPVPDGLEEQAFLTLPRACGGPLATVFDATSWKEETANGVALTHGEVEPEGIQDCEGLPPFEAGISSQPTTNQASSPAGLDFGLHPNDEGLLDPAKRAQSDIKAVDVTLPEGMAINPSSANGLEACSPAQYKAEGPQWNPLIGCPQASKVGTVEVHTPLLNETLEGDIFVAEQGNNPFGTLFALYMVIRSERYGVLVKQAGRVDPDPQTGQLRSTFENIPQLPFSDFEVHFREGPRSPLATPSTCGTHTATAVLTPWSGAPITATSSFDVSSGPGGGPCPSNPLPFSPGLTGGTDNSKAGSFSPFSMRITRSDGEQAITRLDSVLPAGVVGKIAGLGRCSDAAIAAAKSNSGRTELSAPSCPADSRIGTVRAGAGVGSLPTYVDGSLYLAGPYAGAPLSVVAITPAVTGPFDLGTVVIREALDLNPSTAEVEVKGSGSEGQIPTILQGVPLQLRDLRVEIDRPNFTLNATNCEPETLRATLSGTSSSATPSTRYQASGCGELGFKPKLTLKMKGGTKRGQFPAVSSTLTPRAGDANIGSAVVFLPPSEQIENSHINNPCTRVQFNAEECPAKSILGKAKAITPLLDAPLEGNVYFRSNGGERELPDIVADLRGQFHIVLVGFIDTKGKRIRTTFANVPDAPVSKFTLNLFGGKKGLLVNNRNICKGTLRSKLNLTGQNGRRYFTEPRLKPAGCKGKGGGKKGGKGKR